MNDTQKANIVVATVLIAAAFLTLTLVSWAIFNSSFILNGITKEDVILLSIYFSFLIFWTGIMFLIFKIRMFRAITIVGAWTIFLILSSNQLSGATQLASEKQQFAKIAEESCRTERGAVNCDGKLVTVLAARDNRLASLGMKMSGSWRVIELEGKLMPTFQAFYSKK